MMTHGYISLSLNELSLLGQVPSYGNKRITLLLLSLMNGLVHVKHWANTWIGDYLASVRLYWQQKLLDKKHKLI